jgi:hypothetical protein
MDCPAEPLAARLLRSGSSPRGLVRHGLSNAQQPVDDCAARMSRCRRGGLLMDGGISSCLTKATRFVYWTDVGQHSGGLGKPLITLASRTDFDDV